MAHDEPDVVIARVQREQRLDYDGCVRRARDKASDLCVTLLERVNAAGHEPGVTAKQDLLMIVTMLERVLGQGRVACGTSWQHEALPPNHVRVFVQIGRDIHLRVLDAATHHTVQPGAPS